MDPDQTRFPLRIGQLADDLGLNPTTIRYYEAIGLLPPPRRSASGYRLYGAADRDRLHFIGKAKAIGLSLDEIGEILALRDGGTAPCDHVRDLLDQRLAAVDAQLRALTGLRQELTLLRADAETPADGRAHVCGIIEHHASVHHAASHPASGAPAHH